MHTIMPPPGLVYSDVRQKRDLQQLDVLPNGIKLYRYRYRWSATEYVGVLAHEVAALLPEAVSKDADGFFRVDYRHLGLQLRTYEDWVNKGHMAILSPDHAINTASRCSAAEIPCPT
jgi:hypothetical protein